MIRMLHAEDKADEILNFGEEGEEVYSFIKNNLHHNFSAVISSRNLERVYFIKGGPDQPNIGTCLIMTEQNEEVDELISMTDRSMGKSKSKDNIIGSLLAIRKILDSTKLN